MIPPPSRCHGRRVAAGLCLWIAAGVFCPAVRSDSASSAEPDSISWRGDYGGALEEARTANRLLWIQFTGPWCPNCTRMERDSFPDPDVIEHTRKSFVPLKLRSDVHEQLAMAFNLSGLPATVIVAPTNREIMAVRQGYMGPDELDALLSEAHAAWRGRERGDKTEVARSGPAAQGQPDPASAHAKSEPPQAISGYCLVSLIADKRLVPGQTEYSVRHEGQVYRFASAAKCEQFRKEPDRYMPANQGACPVSQVDHGTVRPGGPKWGVLYQERLFLCASADARRRFLEDPDHYVMVDVAEQGFCPHCLTETGLLVRGDPKYAATHDGRRFWFPDPSHRDAFLAGNTKTTQR